MSILLGDHRQFSSDSFGLRCPPSLLCWFQTGGFEDNLYHVRACLQDKNLLASISRYLFPLQICFFLPYINLGASLFPRPETFTLLTADRVFGILGNRQLCEAVLVK
jgi:hypothetical protein